jgi:[protein-PII] uridylyltransferase
MRSDATSLKEAFERALDAARRAHESGEGGHTVAALHASSVDDVLHGVFAGALAQTGRPSAGVALVALGGYGRGELAPHSDLDLLVVHRGWPAPDVEALNRALVYPLWDAGRDLGNRVREARDILKPPARLDEWAALLDARFLAGDHRFYVDLEGSLLANARRSRAAFFRALGEETARRHTAYGHAGHLLEPDVRDSAGGLRDLHALCWAAKLLPQSPGPLDALVAAGYLSQADRDAVGSASDFLTRVRVELHLRAGRRQDRLYLQDQDAVAAGLGYSDGDELMRELYRHAREVDAVSSSVRERLAHAVRRFRRSHARTVGDGCVIREGRLDVVAAVPPHEDAAGWLQVFVHAHAAGVAVTRTSLNWLRSLCAAAPDAHWTAAARDAFVDILRAGATDALEAMDAAGFLGLLVPEWSPVRCAPQRNLYHRFTVDMHGFETVAELARGVSSDEPDVADAWSRVGDTEALFLGALLHDVGKARGGDHIELGVPLARAAVSRMGFGEGVVEDVSFLVREHLTLAEAAVRRDLNDERTIERTVLRAGDPRRLAMLFLLTRADSLATGPEAWSGFRASLVRELYAKALHALERGPVTFSRAAHEADTKRAAVLRELADVPAADRLVDDMPLAWLLSSHATPAQLRMMTTVPAPGEVRMDVSACDDADTVTIVARDRPGLFAAITGALASRSVDVLAADIWTRRDGAALEVFRVRGAHGPLASERWESIREDVRRAVAGDLDVRRALRERAATTRPPAVAGREPRVLVDNATSDFATVVEVHATDRPGLLHTITSALADAGCDLQLAKVATYGVDVVDVFYVRDLDGQRIVDRDRIAEIERSILAALGVQ